MTFLCAGSRVVCTVHVLLERDSISKNDMPELTALA